MTASRTIANHASEFGGKRVLVTGGTRGAGKAIVAATHARDSAALMAAFS